MVCHKFSALGSPQSERDAQEITTERVKQYELYSSAQISVVGDPSRRDDPAYLGHFANDASTCDSPDALASYESASAAAANAEPVLLEGCHFALEASRDIAEGEEVLFSYGAGYWLARAGHGGVGSDLRLVGSAVSAAKPAGDALKRALAAARPKKKGGKGGASPQTKKKKGKKAEDSRSAARGFG